MLLAPIWSLCCFYWVNILRNWGGVNRYKTQLLYVKKWICDNMVLSIIFVFVLIGIQFFLTPYSEANLARLETGNLFIFIGLAMLGTVIYWMLSVVIGKCKLLEWLGINSLVIFALHGPIYRALLFVVSFVTKTNVADIRNNLFMCLFVSIFTVVSLIPFVLIWNKLGKPLTK